MIYLAELLTELGRRKEAEGTVQRRVFSARHAGLRSGGMGTVSDDI
jgi:hypothetical protein